MPAEEVLIDRTAGLRRLTEKKEEEAPFFSSNSAFSLKRALNKCAYCVLNFGVSFVSGAAINKYLASSS